MSVYRRVRAPQCSAGLSVFGFNVGVHLLLVVSAGLTVSTERVFICGSVCFSFWCCRSVCV